MGYRNTRAQSCDCAPIICLCAPHICNLEIERAGCAWDRCDHSITVKKPFHDYCKNWYIQTAGFPNGVSIFIICASPARKPQRVNRHLRAPDPARVSRRSTNALNDYSPKFSGRACEVHNDPLDHPRNLPAHRPLAERISRANLEAIEPLARVGMRKGNAPAQR